MNNKKLSTVPNISNQANFIKASGSHLSQFNYIIILGREYLEKYNENPQKIPLSITINKLGEIEISNIDRETLNDKHDICIYSDKKISDSGE